MSSTKNPSPASSKSTPTKPSTAVRAGKYTFVGIILTVFNFGLYTIIARLMGNNDFLWLDTFISTAATTILAYILHSKITWKERSPGKSGIYKFFIWNALCAVIIGPFFTWLFTLITPLYDFTFDISQALNLPFEYEFIQSTGAFVLTAIITMILNFLFYDKFVFGKKPPQNSKN